MIYFDRPTQATLVNRLAEHLRPGGYLLIGHSESLNSISHPLTYVGRPSSEGADEVRGRQAANEATRSTGVPPSASAGMPASMIATTRRVARRPPRMSRRGRSRPR